MKTHQKMCWNCDGHVHVYELQCPYCGADLSEEEQSEEDLFEEVFEEEQDEQAHLNQEDLEEDLSRPPFHSLVQDEEEELLEEEEEVVKKEAKGDLENPLASLLLLLPGTLFFLFGLALILFAQDGFLVFRFSAKYWFLYLVGSWPLLYFGWRSLFPAKPIVREKAEESEEIEEA